MLDSPPIFKESSLFGNIRSYQRNPLDLLINAHKQCGDIVRIPFGLVSAYLVTHPDYIKYVLQDNHKNYTNQSRGIKLLKKSLGNGILTSDGAVWKEQRQEGQKVFTPGNVKGMFDDKVRVVREVLSDWEEDTIKQNTFEIEKELSRISMQIVFEVLFKVKVDLKDIYTIYDLFKESDSLYDHRLKKVASFPYWVPTRLHRKIWKLEQRMNYYIFYILKEIKEKFNGDKDYLFSKIIFGKGCPLHSKKNDIDSAHRMLAYLIAGFRTVSTALTWTFYLLAQHPNYTERLYDEMSGYDEKGVLDNLDKLTLLDMTVKESLRMYPPIWILVRKALQDDVIDGFRIKKNSPVIICPYITHRHEQFWSDPEVFMPERFAQLNSRAYLPFGLGPRVCLGRSFALKEMKIIIALFIKKFKFTCNTDAPILFSPLFTFAPSDSIDLKLTPR